ncbi:MAG: PEP-CTERM sorting domain-containing protein [Bryobacteraceae bacterium]
MSSFKAYRNALFAAAVALFAVCQSQAGAIAIGSADSVNAMPFEDITSGTYQQIYSSSDFGSSPLSLTGVTFFGQNGSSITYANYTVDVSTITAALGYYTLYQPGADNTQEFSGALGGLITGGSFTIPFSQAFNYNPSEGNLLLQIGIAGGPSSPGGLGLGTMSNGGDLFSRSYNVYSGAIHLDTADSTGLVTQFDTPASSSAVPEPGTFLLLGTALIGGGLVRRRKFAQMLRLK